MKSLLLMASLLALTGCATCERHPVACWAGAVIVAGSIAASTNHRTDGGHIPTPSVDCSTGGCR